MGFIWEEPPMKKYLVTLNAAERQPLQRVAAAGKAPARKLAHARILLQADAAHGGPAWTDERIAEALDVGASVGTRPRRRRPTAPQPAGGKLLATIPRKMSCARSE